MSIRQRIYQRIVAATQDPRRAMKQFTTGGFAIVAGMMVILLADRYFVASLEQEWVSLFGLIIVAIGVMTALWGYLSISLFKVISILLEDKNDRNQDS